MSKRILFIGCLCMAFCAGILFNTRNDNKHISADDYEERSIPVPFGNPVEDHDYSAQADALHDIGEKAADAVSETTDKLAAYDNVANKVLDTADDVSDTVSAGSGFVRSLLNKATDLVNNIPIP